MKVEHFEYAIAKLIEWFCASNLKTIDEFNRQNDFSKLKILKLHFFVSAINSNTNSLLDLFDNFYAMPYGHVESELYDQINGAGLKRFHFLGNHLIINPEFANIFESFEAINNSIHKREIDSAIESLKKENVNLINCTALELVDISHQWISWKMTFEMAKAKSKYSAKISSEIIRLESKYFKIAY